MNQEISIQNYNEIFRQIVAEIKSTRVIIANRINNSMIQMYWNIGKRLSIEGLEKGYGSNVVNRLSSDLQSEFPGMSGFSPRSLWDMKRLYEFYNQENTRGCVKSLTHPFICKSPDFLKPGLFSFP